MEGVVAPVAQREQAIQEEAYEEVSEQEEAFEPTQWQSYEQMQEQTYEPTLVQPQEQSQDLSAKGAYLMQLLQLLLVCDEQTVHAK